MIATMASNTANLSQRPRMFSLNSKKSVRSPSYKGVHPSQKLDMHETHEEKQKRTITSKADPMLAMTEAQPSAVAVGESSMAPIRAMQHKDINGNPIESGDALSTLASRRSSYHQGYGNQGRGYHDGGYGGRPGPARPDSYVDGYYGQGPPARPRMNQRMTPEPGLHEYDGGQVGYPSHGYQQSYDTVTTGSGSGSHGTDPWGNSTDPSSDNSSLDRGHHLPKQDTGEHYGHGGVAGAPQHPHNGYGDYDQGQVNRQGYGQSPLSPSNGRYYEQGENGPPPPPPPHKDVKPPPRVPIKLGGGGGSGGAANGGSYQSGGGLPAAEKRKSWFKRMGRSS